MTQRSLPIVNSLWIGPRLGLIQVRCLQSFLEMGHRFRLYAYEPPSDLPEGVELADAEEILPAEEIVVHRETGSPSLFSNRFRYELLARGAGIWADCDVLCVRPLDDPDPYLFGFEVDDFSINCAVLRLPALSPLLADLLSTFRPGWVPPWLAPAEQEACRRQMRENPEFGPGDLPWGSYGPKAITYYARRRNLFARAARREVYYPDLHDVLLAPDFPLATRITPRTRTLHLLNSILGRVEGAPLSRRSLLAGIIHGEWRQMLARAHAAGGTSQAQ